MTTSTEHGTGSPASTGELLARMSEQTSRLIRDELRLAQAEMTAKSKSAGRGVGLFGGAGLVSVYGLGCLVAAAVLGLAQTLDGWLAALIVGAALFVVAGVAALVGKRNVSAATPVLPQEAVAGLQQDVRTLKAGTGA